MKIGRAHSLVVKHRIHIAKTLSPILSAPITLY